MEVKFILSLNPIDLITLHIDFEFETLIDFKFQLVDKLKNSFHIKIEEDV